MREIKVSFEQYQTYTCITFVERKNERAYLYFQPGGGYVCVKINMIYQVLKYEFCYYIWFVKVNNY